MHEGTGDNHAISALKFKIIQEFLQLGWNVLLSDVDIVVIAVRHPLPFASAGMCCLLSALDSCIFSAMILRCASLGRAFWSQSQLTSSISACAESI